MCFCVGAEFVVQCPCNAMAYTELVIGVLPGHFEALVPRCACSRSWCQSRAPQWHPTMLGGMMHQNTNALRCTELQTLQASSRANSSRPNVIYVDDGSPVPSRDVPFRDHTCRPEASPRPCRERNTPNPRPMRAARLYGAELATEVEQSARSDLAPPGVQLGLAQDTWFAVGPPQQMSHRETNSPIFVPLLLQAGGFLAEPAQRAWERDARVGHLWLRALSMLNVHRAPLSSVVAHLAAAMGTARFDGRAIDPRDSAVLEWCRSQGGNVQTTLVHVLSATMSSDGYIPSLTQEALLQVYTGGRSDFLVCLNRIIAGFHAGPLRPLSPGEGAPAHASVLCAAPAPAAHLQNHRDHSLTPTCPRARAAATPSLADDDSGCCAARSPPPQSLHPTVSTFPPSRVSAVPGSSTYGTGAVSATRAGQVLASNLAAEANHNWFSSFPPEAIRFPQLTSHVVVPLLLSVA